MEEIKNVIYTICDKKKVSSPEEIIETMSLRNDLGFDSFKLAQLTVELEDLYDVDIFKNGNIDLVGDIINCINNSKQY
jgi:acyl carrier protein